MSFFKRWFGGGESGRGRVPEEEPEDAGGGPEFPYELMRVPGAEAAQQALAWRKEWRGAFTPVILGKREDFAMLSEILSEVTESPQEIMRRAQALDLGAFFARRLAESAALEDVTDASDWKPRAEEEGEFHTLARPDGRIVPWVQVAKVPAAQPCDVPAYLKLGGWNACPLAEEHVAVWGHWQKEYGAEILCVTSDVIEATVARPPQEKEACYALAREQFGYCDDIVTQGVGSIDALASTLRDGRKWFFWWD